VSIPKLISVSLGDGYCLVQFRNGDAIHASTGPSYFCYSRQVVIGLQVFEYNVDEFIRELPVWIRIWIWMEGNWDQFRRWRLESSSFHSAGSQLYHPTLMGKMTAYGLLMVCLMIGGKRRKRKVNGRKRKNNVEMTLGPPMTRTWREVLKSVKGAKFPLKGMICQTGEQHIPRLHQYSMHSVIKCSSSAAAAYVDQVRNSSTF
jgi:hypothetical protein